MARKTLVWVMRDFIHHRSNKEYSILFPLLSSNTHDRSSISHQCVTQIQINRQLGTCFEQKTTRDVLEAMPKLFSCHKKGSSTVGNPRISAQKTLLSSIPGGFFSTSGRYMSTSSADSLADKGQQQQAPPPPAELSKANQLKAAVKDYGSTVIVFHVAISLASLAGFYAAVSSGLDVVGLVGRLPFVGEKVASSGFGAGASTFVLAYAVHKAFAPVRISITLTATPFIVKYLRRKGILKMKQKLP